MKLVLRETGSWLMCKSRRNWRTWTACTLTALQRSLGAEATLPSLMETSVPTSHGVAISPTHYVKGKQNVYLLHILPNS